MRDAMSWCCFEWAVSLSLESWSGSESVVKSGGGDGGGLESPCHSLVYLEMARGKGVVISDRDCKLRPSSTSDGNTASAIPKLSSLPVLDVVLRAPEKEICTHVVRGGQINSYCHRVPVGPYLL